MKTLATKYAKTGFQLFSTNLALIKNAKLLSVICIVIATLL